MTRLRAAVRLAQRGLRFWLPLLWNAARRPRPLPGSPPLVTVIIATYNWSSVLRHALRSATGQRYENLEVLVVGDGCTDDSAHVVASCGDRRVRWIGLPTNSGSQSAPNNAGLREARGKYVAYHGHDDVWHPDHLLRAVGALERARADFAYPRAEMIGPAGSHIRDVTGSIEDGLPASVIVHRRDLVDRVGPWKDYRTIVPGPDREFCQRVAASSARTIELSALTVFKFNSAWRKNSYLEKPSHEQAAYLERLAREGATFTLREISQILRLRLFGPPPIYPQFAEPPAPDTPGWQVTQWRQARGLE